MTWELEYLPEAIEDLKRLDMTRRKHVIKAIEKVRTNPYPQWGDVQGRCGYGKPLGNKMGFELAGLLKIKLRDDGIRVVYKLEEVCGVMRVIVIGARTDADVYRDAARRRAEHGL